MDSGGLFSVENVKLNGVSPPFVSVLKKKFSTRMWVMVVVGLL